jgi:hypothetical protein
LFFSFDSVIFVTRRKRLASTSRSPEF